MSHVESLHYYPLTGAQAISPEVVDVRAAGIAWDRRLVLYDSTIDGLEAENRVSQKQIRALATVALTPLPDTEPPFFAVEGHTGRDILLFTECDAIPPDVYVNEFGDIVPSVSLAPASENFGHIIGNRPELRVAQKHNSWFEVGPEEVAIRAVAPLHIVFTASVHELQRRAKTSSFGAERFRPNIVVDNEGGAPFSENDWVGNILHIGDVPILIQRPTKRCPVPGFDQATGVNKKDVPKLYPGLEKVDGKPIFGVYGYPLLDAGKLQQISVEDSVYLDTA